MSLSPTPIPASESTPTTRDPDRRLDNELIAMLRSHGPREGEALAAYQRLVDHAEDEGVRYLGRLILDDERQHHAVLEEMLNVVQSFVWEVDLQPRVPDAPTPGDRALLDETKRLLALERADAKELRRLRKALKHNPHYPMLALLVELMIHDTAKHVAILEFIRRHIQPR
jgi:hypothetical protein